MTRHLTTLTALSFSMPLCAHENMELNGPLHRFLHFVGSDTLLAVGGLLIAGVVAFVARRLLRDKGATTRANSAR